jgi:hypothetical protein
LAWEKRWARPVAVATFGSLLLIIAAILVASQGVGGSDGESELLRNVEAHRSAQLISSILQAIGVGLLAAPLYYLFLTSSVPLTHAARRCAANSLASRSRRRSFLLRWRSSAVSPPCTLPLTSSATKCLG